MIPLYFSDNESLSIKAYELVIGDHPDDVRKGRVFACINKFSSVRRLLNPYSREILIFEVCRSNKTLYGSPSETTDEVDSFVINLKNISRCIQ